MSHLSRRRFLSLGAASIAAHRSAFASSDEILQHPLSSIKMLKQPRVLGAAQQFLLEQPGTIVSAPALRTLQTSRCDSPASSSPALRIAAKNIWLSGNILTLIPGCPK